MSNIVPSGPAGNVGEFLTNWINNGKIPGAVKAIAHVVGASGEALAAGIDIAKAKAEQVAQGIRDDTSARTVVRAEMARQVTAILPEDKELARRASARWIGDEMRGQSNLEHIAVIAIDDIEKSQPGPDVEQPEEEWLDHFSKHARSASSDRARKIWAKVLAGEIRQTSSFSLSTLQIISILDTQIAAAFNKFCGFLVQGRLFITDDYLKSGEGFEELNELGSIGLVRVDFTSYMSLDFDQQKNIPFAFSNHLVMLSGEGQRRINSIFLTRSGRELASIIDVDDNLERITQIVDYLNKSGICTAQLFPSSGLGKIFRAMKT